MNEPEIPEYIKKIHEGKAVIYIATKLFDYVEKIKAELFESCVSESICKALYEYQLKYEKKVTFVPFRDTKEHEIKEKDKAKIIYEGDISRLSSNNLIALIALFNDISKDEGISFEIGYAYGKRVPIFILVTDFIWYALRASPSCEFVLDPVIHNMTSRLIHHCEIPNEHSSFIENLFLGLTNAFKKFEEEFYRFLLVPSKYETEYFEIPVDRNSVFVDFAGGKCEYHRSYMKYLRKKIQKSGLNVTKSIRFDPQPGLTSLDVFSRGKVDLMNSLRSDIIIISGEESQMDSGSAAILGLARALDKKIILYNSRNIEIHGEGGLWMIKNLMIDYSADHTCNYLKKIPNLVRELIGEE